VPSSGQQESYHQRAFLSTNGSQLELAGIALVWVCDPGGAGSRRAPQLIVQMAP
jgi:hypothetical protein